MRLTYPMLIMVIIITVLITYGILKYLDGVTIIFVKKAQYIELITKEAQSQERIAKLEMAFNKLVNELVRVYSNLNKILKEKKVIP